MVRRDVEVALFLQHVEDLLEFAGRNKRHGTTGFTRQVLVVVFQGEVPLCRLRPQVNVMDGADVGELAQRPVTGGGVNRPSDLLHLGHDLPNGEESLLVAGQDGADGATLKSQPKPGLSDSLEEGFFSRGRISGQDRLPWLLG